MKKVSIIILGAVVSLAGLVGLTAPSVNAQSALPASPSYVALGDSVAAGAGLAPYFTGNQDAACQRSPQAYPYLLAGYLGARFTDAACSGAKSTAGIINAQTISGATVPSQLDRAFQNGKPDLITITIGANDIRWTDIIGKCYQSTCGPEQGKVGYGKDLGAVAGLLTTLQGKLGYTLHKIKDYSGSSTPPKVLITGYYNPISSTSCLNGRLSSQELTWINFETANLNKAIIQTVNATSKVSSLFKGTYNFATFVPVSFDGHGLCSNDPWVQGVDGLAPLHPTAVGQRQFANTLYQYAR